MTLKSTRLFAPTRVFAVQTRHRFNQRSAAVNESRCSLPAVNYYNVARVAIGPVIECTYAAQTFTFSISPSLNCRILKRGRTQIQISICFKAGCAARLLRDWLLRRGCREGAAPAIHSLGLCLCVCDLADEDAVLRVADVSLLVHVGGGDGEHGAVVVEGQRGDAGRVAVELTQPLLVEGVPDVDEAVRAAWQGQRVKGLTPIKACPPFNLDISD